MISKARAKQLVLFGCRQTHLALDTEAVQYSSPERTRHSSQLLHELVVEGTLIGPWVSKLRTTCGDASQKLGGRKLVIDLSELTVISRAREDVIFDLMKEGAKFSRGGVLTRHVLKRLARKCSGEL